MRIKLVLRFAIIFILAALVFGTTASKFSGTPAKSPYVSALANVSVGTAEAARCNGSCEVLQGHQFCRFEGFQTKCVVVSGRCQLTACR